jgi:uncharacterized protein (TIGR02466 family)
MITTNGSSVDTTFATKIFHKVLPNFEEENKKITNRLYTLKNTTKGLDRSNQLGWHSDVNIQSYPEFDEFNKHLKFTLGEIFTFYDYDPNFELDVHSFWGNINPKYGYNNTHSHPHCLWSGVYYVQTPENCGNIHFVDPVKPRIHYQAQFRNDKSLLASSSIFYVAEASKLIIFPAYLEHFVKPNMSDTDRISLSFNIRLNPKPYK